MYALPLVYHISHAEIQEKQERNQATPQGHPKRTQAALVVEHRFRDLFSLQCIRFAVISAGVCLTWGYFYYLR